MNPQRMDKLARIEAGDYPATHDLVTMAQAVNYNRFLTDVIRRELGDRRVVVDHGAGLGTLALLLRERGVAPVCVENEPAHMAHLREEGFRVVGSTAELPDASADFIYSLNVLEHIDDDAAELRAMASAWASLKSWDLMKPRSLNSTPRRFCRSVILLSRSTMRGLTLSSSS